MICPYCGTHISDTSVVCPACHAELQKTVMMPRLEASYCQNCGALVPAGASSCPACGIPVSYHEQVATTRPSSTVQSVPATQAAPAAPQNSASSAVSALSQLPKIDATGAFSLDSQATHEPSPEASIPVAQTEPKPLAEVDDQRQALLGLLGHTSLDETAPSEPTPANTNVYTESAHQAGHMASISPSSEPEPTAPADDSEAEATNAMPRIESAIPSFSTNGYSNERLPHLRAVIFTAAVALLVVGGSALMISHPWDPDAFQSHNTQARDTSKAGFPGQVDKLSGQDSTGSAVTVESGDEASYKKFSSYYEELGKQYEALSEADKNFSSLAYGSDAEALKKQADSVSSLKYQVSNLISSIGEVDVSSGTYADTQQNLLTLGNWLRNWVDTLDETYQAALSSSNPTADKSQIEARLQAERGASGADTYASLFDQNYDSWKPEEPSS